MIRFSSLPNVFLRTLMICCAVQAARSSAAPSANEDLFGLLIRSELVGALWQSKSRVRPVESTSEEPPNGRPFPDDQLNRCQTLFE